MTDLEDNEEFWELVHSLHSKGPDHLVKFLRAVGDEYNCHDLIEELIEKHLRRNSTVN